MAANYIPNFTMPGVSVPNFTDMGSKVADGLTSGTCVIALLLGIIVCILFILIHFMNKNECSKEKIVTKIRSITSSDTKTNLICNFYIKSSYNSCVTGKFLNGWVNLCALDHVIQQGCRVLDFEIYSVNGKCAVAASNSVKFTEKGTYNSIPIGDVLERIRNKAVSQSEWTEHCPNPRDPLFLHFRMKTESEDVYAELARSIASNLGSVLISPTYSIKNYKSGTSVAATSINFCSTMTLEDLMGQVVIIVDKSSHNLESSVLGELVHIVGKGQFFHSLNYNDIAFSPDEGIADFNSLGNMTYCYPSLSVYPTNYSSFVAMKNGVQMCGLCFQNNDVHLKAYNSFFDTATKAFVLKTNKEGKYTPV
jgi:hypothetical protein